MVKVLTEIAKGGFGRVEKVELDDGTIAARKVFSPLKEIADAVGREKLLRRFSREVKYQSNLPHELFIPIISSDLDSETPSLLMPLADANFVHEIRAFRATGNLPLEALLHVLDSLEWLHEHDFVHRDVKPHNVLFHEGRWKLSDFGLILPPSDETERLTTYQGFFTEMYCAPAASRLQKRDPRALFGVLEKLEERVWVPYRVALEYHRSRLRPHCLVHVLRLLSEHKSLGLVRIRWRAVPFRTLPKSLFQIPSI